MTTDLSNVEFAAHMRTRRGATPTVPESPIVFHRVKVWLPGHREIPFPYAPVDGVSPDDYTVMIHVVGGTMGVMVRRSECARIDRLETSNDGPDIWDVTFMPGRTPKGW